MKTLKLIIPVMLILLVSACVKNTGTGNGNPGKGASLTITGTNRVEGAMNDSLVIVGTGFTADTSKDIVTINDVRAPILSATATEIIAKVPVRAFSGNIVVKVGGKSVTGPRFGYLVTSGVVSTFAGNTNLGPGYSDGIGTNARFFGPVALALDTTRGNLYVADLFNRRIRKIALQDAAVTAFAGNGTYGDEDGNGASAEFGSINGLAVAKNGAVYVADADYDVIRAISADGTLVTTVAGQAGQSGYSDNTASTSLFNRPMGLTFDITGNLIIVDQGNKILRELTTLSMDVTSLTTGANGNFNQANGIAYNPRNSDVYVADAGSNQIKAFTVTGEIYTYFGNGTLGYLNGIKGAPVEFNRPQGLAFDNNYNVYVVDTFNNCIRMIDNQYNVTTLVGSTESGLVDGSGAAAKFNEPYAVVVDNINHYLYVADTGNNCIRKVVLE